MDYRALEWIIVTVVVIVVIMCLLNTYIDILRCGGGHGEGYWPEPYFMGEYTQNNRERYFDYVSLPHIYRKVENSKV